MKDLLRQQILQQRLAHPSSHKNGKEAAIQKHLVESPFFQKAQTILFYYPIKEEVSLLPLFENYKGEKICCFPRVEKNNHLLTLHHVKKAEELELGPYNIPQPKASAPLINPKQFELIMVPGVLFARDGHRLGYGKGYYDRLLKTTYCLHLGVAFQFQLIDQLPDEPHDVPVDMIVTEEGIIECTKRI